MELKLEKIKEYLGGFADAHLIEDGIFISGLGGSYRIEYDYTIEDYVVSGENISVTEVEDIIHILMTVGE